MKQGTQSGAQTKLSTPVEAYVGVSNNDMATESETRGPPNRRVQRSQAAHRQTSRVEQEIR